MSGLFRHALRLQTILAYVLLAVRIRFSVNFHLKTTSEYWSTPGVPTGGPGDPDEMIMYFRQILDLVPADIGKTMVDYGGGYGEIANLFLTQGYEASVAEFFDSFRAHSQGKGMPYLEASSLPKEYFDLIVANNCLFYVHPSNLIKEVARLMDSLTPGGVLLITDTPTLAKISYLDWSLFQKWFGALTRVHDPRAGGFFVDGSLLEKKFTAVSSPSWSSYREHFLIRKLD
jgi:SAM-dependent methyltransferase